MGVFKKFIAGIALECLNCYDVNGAIDYTVPTYKAVDGTERTTVGFYPQSSYFSHPVPYSKLTPIATQDSLDNYNLYDYQIIGAGVTTYSKNRVITNTGGSLVYSISINNNTQETITIKCIKFRKVFSYTKGGFDSDTDPYRHLVCAYYLDENEWVTLAPGETGAVTVVMTVGI